MSKKSTHSLTTAGKYVPVFERVDTYVNNDPKKIRRNFRHTAGKLRENIRAGDKQPGTDEWRV